MSENFKFYSKYYDLLYHDKDYDRETEYILSLIKKFAPNSRSILELGSGTGKHARLVSKQGFFVHGIEKSKEMVAIASSHQQKNVHFEVGDISAFNLGKKFDITLSLFHVISYLTSNLDLNNTFEAVRNHLCEKGVFIFDVWYSPAVFQQQPETRIKRLSNEKINILRIAEPVIHHRKNIVDVNYEVLIENRQDHSYSSFQETHPMRHFSEPEMELLASSTGFSVLHTEEFLTGSTPGPNTWGVCFILQKL